MIVDLYEIIKKPSIMVFCQRAWQALAGVFTLFFIAHYLTPVEQGYYYTLGSIAALNMALDMGLSAVLVQFAAKEFDGLSWGSRGGVEGVKRSRFLALARLSMRWYGIGAMVFLAVYPAGIGFIADSQDRLPYDWRSPWCVLVCATAVNFIFLPVLALIEGSGQIAEVYAVRLVQGVVGAVATWVSLLMGCGLYSITVMPAIGAVIAAIWLILWRSEMLIQFFREKCEGLSWRTEVWPLQWRIGVSWFAGYALVTMHAPLVFKFQGSIAAGQMGVTMTVANMLCMLAFSWMTAKIPKMTRLCVTKDWGELDRIFWRAFRYSLIAFVVGASSFAIARWLLEWTPYGARFLPIQETIGLLLAMGFYHVAGLFAAYMRSHLQEPFLWPSLFGALLTAAVAIWIAPQWGATGIVMVLLFVNVFFFFPAALGIWTHCRKKWHNLTN